MLSKKLKTFLDQHHVKYTIVQHAPAYTAQEIAATSHVSGKEFAKSVVVKVDGKMALLVESANQKVNFDHFKKFLKNGEVELASEFEFETQFPECELGAMPPFGNLYDMEVYVSENLTHEKNIVFNAGDHSELIKISFQDFERLVKPKIISL